MARRTIPTTSTHRSLPHSMTPYAPVLARSVWTTTWITTTILRRRPTTCRSTVWRANSRLPYAATCRWSYICVTRTRTRSAPRTLMRTTCCARSACPRPVAYCTASARTAPRWSALWIWVVISPMAARLPLSATMTCARHSRQPRSTVFCSRRIVPIWRRSPFAVLNASPQ